MSSSPDKTDTPTYIDTADTSRSSTDSLSGSVEQSVKEFMNVSYNNDSRLSLEQLPVTETEITEPQATQYKTSMTESEFTKFRCTKSMPAESKVNSSTLSTPNSNPLNTSTPIQTASNHKANSQASLLPISLPSSSTSKHNVSNHKLLSQELAKKLNCLVDDDLLVSPASEHLNQDCNIIDHILEEMSCKRKLIFSSPSKEKEVPEDGSSLVITLYKIRI